MSNNSEVVVRDYTTKELYEITRAKRNTSSFFSKPSSNVRFRLQQLDNQIKQGTHSAEKHGRGLRSSKR